MTGYELGQLSVVAKISLNSNIKKSIGHLSLVAKKASFVGIHLVIFKFQSLPSKNPIMENMEKITFSRAVQVVIIEPVIEPDIQN